jgi:hypothetical protein
MTELFTAGYPIPAQRYQPAAVLQCFLGIGTGQKDMSLYGVDHSPERRQGGLMKIGNDSL